MRDRVEIADAETLIGHGYRAFWFESTDEGCSGCEVFDRENQSAEPV